VYLACDDGTGQPGIVSTDDTPMPPQFIVKKNDEVDAGRLMVIDVESAPSAEFFQSMFFVLKTYEGEALATTTDATIVLDVASANAQIFRAPLVVRITSTIPDFGVRRGVALGISRTCALTYYDPKFEKKTLLANTNCADLVKAIGWPAVADQNLPAAYLTAATTPPKGEHR
jgi:hypothetical protein